MIYTGPKKGQDHPCPRFFCCTILPARGDRVKTGVRPSVRDSYYAKIANRPRPMHTHMREEAMPAPSTIHSNKITLICNTPPHSPHAQQCSAPVRKRTNMSTRKTKNNRDNKKNKCVLSSPPPALLIFLRVARLDYNQSSTYYNQSSTLDRRRPATSPKLKITHSISYTLS